jgi:hypothetical protein
MKYHIALLVFLLSFSSQQFCMGQMVTVKGRLVSNDGEPLPGVVITIKGTTTGVMTDADGNYSINAPADAILVFSYIGFTTREVPVYNLINNTPEKEDQTWKAWISNLKNKRKPGDQDIFYHFTPVRGRQARLIRKYDTDLNQKDNRIVLWPSFYNLSVISSFSASVISRRPDLQKEYTEGRNDSGKPVWKGPEDNETFSWGPAFSSVEYDGVPYTFDANGRIVGKGLGNGKPVNYYNPYHFFQTGFSNNQSVALSLANTTSSLRLSYNYSDENGVIPCSGIEKNNFTLKFFTRYKSDLKISFGINATLSDINFLSGFSQFHLMQSVLNTPVTFNNATKLNSSEYLANPYSLEEKLVDNEKSEWIRSNLNIKYDIFSWLCFNVTGSLEHQGSRDRFGIKNSTYGFTDATLTNRKSNLYSSFLKTGFNTIQNNYSSLKVTGGIYYELSEINETIKRGDVSSIETVHTSDLARTVNSANSFLNININDFLISDLNARLISSPSFPRTYIKPKIGLALIPSQMGFYYSNWINSIKIFGSFSEGINAPPVNYRRGMFNSTLFSSDELYSYYETAEFLKTGTAKPEQSDRWEFGTNIILFRNLISTEVSVYSGNTRDLLVPQFNSGYFNEINGCDIHSSGIDLDIQFFKWFSYFGSITSSVTFSRNRTSVRSVNTPSGFIVIGGLENVPVVLMKGKPYGVIMGNSFLKNDKGQVVIGADGFPVVDDEMKVIGNPNPSWTLDLSNSFSIKDFTLSFTLDIRKGGDVWNGTRSTLNYLGLSKESGDKRMVNSYIFKGVYADGTTNNTPVSFYDTSLPLDENRWVRYGISGVASEAVEDGSWIRLSEISLTYDIPNGVIRKWNISQMKLKVFAGNLFVITRYTGVDPQSRFMGFENNCGIDYFNSPGTKTFSAAVEIGLGAGR